MSVLRTLGSEKPRIPGLNEFNEVDLEQLGCEPLLAYIKYTGMQEGQLVRPRWVGAGPTGEVFDDVEAVLTVDAGDLENGLLIKIDNEKIRGAAGGWAFLSYTVVGAQESLRQFCYLGLRERTGDETLSVLQALQSHNLVIQPNKLPIGGVVTVVVPAYQAMQVGDKVNMKVVGYDDSGDECDDWSRVLTVSKEHFGRRPLSADVSRSFFSFLEKGYVEGYYSIELVDGSCLDSPVQRWSIDSDAALPDTLDKPAIDGHQDGEPLDPARFRDGVTVRVPAYAGMAVSDRVVMHWRSPVSDLVQTVRVDPSIQVAGFIPFRVPAETLVLNAGEAVRLSYLYGRQGESLRSDELPVQVKEIRQLISPDVRDADPEATPNWGKMTACDAICGVYVVVPNDIVAQGERLEVHWMGCSELGRYIATEPVNEQNPLRFFIPPEYVPANMARGEKDESRRFEVFYRLISDAGHVDSVAYHLRITPLPMKKLPQLVCPDAPDGKLSLSKVPSTGARLELEPWAYGAAGQLLSLSLTIATDTGEQEIVFHDSVPVTQDEALNGVKATLPKDLLTRLNINDYFTLWPRLSYDGGLHFTKFRSINLQLLQ